MVSFPGSELFCAVMPSLGAPSTSPKAKEFDEEKWLERGVSEGMKCGYGSAAHMAPLLLSLTSQTFQLLQHFNK